MSTLDRYILRELFKISSLGIFVLTSVLFLDKILYLTELIINKDVSLLNVIKLLTYILPAFLVITIPMGVLVGALITFSHFSADNEIVAMKATGTSFIRMLRPVLFLSLFSYLAANIIMIHVLPWGNQSFRNLIFDLLRSHAGYEIKEGVFNDEYNNMMLYVNEKDPQDPRMKGVFISDSTSKNSHRIITAKEGVLLSDKNSHALILQLKNGTIHQSEEGKIGYRLLSFRNYNIAIDIPDPTKGKSKLMKGNREMSIDELLKKIQILREKGKEYNIQLVELHKKFSIPFTCLIMGFIGAPLGIKTARAGRSGGFAVSLVIILLYYICLISGESLGGAGKIPPAIAMWMPNIFITALGGYLVHKTAKETPFVWMEKLVDLIAEYSQKIKKKLFKDIEDLI